MPGLRSLGLGIVALANQKGGVGKTMSAISVATGIARAGGRTLVIDGDPQGNLSLFFGAADKARAGTGDLGSLIAALADGGQPELGAHVIRNVRRNLDLLPAAGRGIRLELGDIAIRRAAPGFREILAAARGRYEWIIIDCSPSNGALERLLVAASEAVVVPLEFQVFSVSGLEALLQEVESAGREAGRPIRVHALLFTKAENRLARVESYREIFSAFRIPVFEICKSEYVPRSLERSRTLWESAPQSYAARDYARLIERAFLE